jgi:hypothetical protein
VKRFGGWFCLALGAAFLIAGVVLGTLAIQQATQISAYHHARACPAGAPSNADCLRAIHGTVTGVTEYPGAPRISAEYALDVRTASTTLHLNFSSDSPMLAYALDGNPAVVTMWRGVPVSVLTDGRSEVTTSVPETALARDLGNGEEAGGAGAFFLFGGVFGIRRNRRADGPPPLTRPVPAAATLALVLGGLAVIFAGFALGGKPSRLGPDLAATGAALAVILGLSVWLGLSVRRRARQAPAGLGRVAANVDDGRVKVRPAAVLPAPPAETATETAPEAATEMATETAVAPPRPRGHPANRARVLAASAAAWLPVVLTVAVLFGIWRTAQDGPVARAFAGAPTCVGETNLDTCAGDFTAVINGVRAPADGADIALVSYTTYDGAINSWASFGGDTAAIVRTAGAEKNARTQLTIMVWRRNIIAAQSDGTWQWAIGDPPGNAYPSLFLAISFALLLLLVRLRIHRRAGPDSSGPLLPPLIDDLGQLAAAAGSVVLLWYGFWLGAIPALAVLLWMGLSVRQSTQRRRMMLAGRDSSGLRIR